MFSPLHRTRLRREKNTGDRERWRVDTDIRDRRSSICAGRRQGGCRSLGEREPGLVLIRGSVGRGLVWTGGLGYARASGV